MDNEYYLNKIHKEILLCFKKFDLFCSRHNIKYYIVGGTLLGAVRHRGFIPWDDDLDIAMDRKNFEKLISLSHMLKEIDLNFRYPCDSKGHLLWFGKIEIENTVFLENYYGELNSRKIGIDVFPLDYSDKIRKKNKYYVGLMFQLVFVAGYKRSGYKNISRKTRFLGLFLSANRAEKLYKVLIKKLSKEKGKYLVNIGSQYGLIKQTFPRDYYGKGVMLKFEDTFMKAPTNFKEILVSIYGKKYKAIPPVERRRSHYPEFIRFSDGEEMHFGNSQDMVTIEESINF